MKNRVAFHNLGCKVNSYELDIMRQILRDEGFEEVPFQDEADIYVVNTCTVTNIADRKSRQMLHRAKKQNPDAVVIAVGCYVETGPARVEADDAIDLVIGNNKKTQIGHILKDFLEKRKEQQAQLSGEKGAKPSFREDLTCSPPFEDMYLTSPGHTRAYIKIQDGCNQFCSYCIIPFARGRIRSRAQSEILREVKGLVADGIREIVLTGIHVSSYGLDLLPEETWKRQNLQDTQETRERQDLQDTQETGERRNLRDTQEARERQNFQDSQGVPESRNLPESQKAEGAAPAASAKPRAIPFDPVRSGEALLGLLTELNALQGLERIRLSSLEPRIMTEGFISALSRLEKVCPHFHLSLQSGCDATLRRMNRHYTTAEYARSVELLRTYYDRPAITTDVIVGFPGETEEEFAQTCAFLEQIRFYEIHVFRYSKRSGTVAARMRGQVPEPVKAVRSDRLLEMTAAQAADFRAQFAGERETILLEEICEHEGRRYWTGSTARYVTGAVPCDARNIQEAPLQKMQEVSLQKMQEDPARNTQEAPQQKMQEDPAADPTDAMYPGMLLDGTFCEETIDFSRGQAMLFCP